jgi:3-oxoadipate enol-lactonase
MAMIELDGFAMNVDIHEGLVASDTVFIHGNLASNIWWQPALEVWQKQAKSAKHQTLKGRLIFVEWRGCGRTDAPAVAADLQPVQLARDVVAALRKLDLNLVNIVGHSTGGLIALEAMVQQPSLFARAVLLDSVGAKGVHFELAALEGFLQMSANREICAAVMASTINNNEPPSPVFEKIVDAAFNVAKMIWTEIPLALSGFNRTEQFAHIRQPVLLLHGEIDPVIPKADSIELASILANARYHEIPKHGHSLNIEDPELFVSLVNAFLFPA